ncbi:M64 family metallopeptidase [Streptomyces sp. DSM 42041]|uniref:M64 family metallopeptidase n=1 Tax=Streptomyces hazeniae TaxID=3075538 RepID=A0ABU2NV36_9ACTN|nr:M64 family metallopeptidase [Streptomyces sp. DSM 42041]MDT0380392.1 M64 family metallopeptidase [Streptomyces sp. DSM 42041]
MRTVRTLAAACTAAAAALALAAPGQAAPAPTPADTPSERMLHVEYFGEDGHPRHTEVPAAAPDRLARDGSHTPGATAGDGDVTTIVQNGSTAEKLDIAVIGDGYTAAELDHFHTDARESWDALLGVEPYTAHADLFNVWAIDAVSAESGVSGDPDQGVVRDTALDSFFWCNGTERLLCVDTNKVEDYAAFAPEADLVVVIANSSKYGGAGYNQVSSGLGYDGIATHSGDNAQSGLVAVHETGHSLGKLADEYAYTDQTYTGPETADSNTSVYTEAEMASRQTKWHRWLGEPTPDGGVIGTFEGAAYHTRGIHRPSENSLMRSLSSTEFNLVGREAMVAGFYRHASVLASDTARTATLTRADEVSVRVPDLTGGASVDVRWYLDSEELRKLRGETTVKVARALAAADGGPHRLRARATVRTDAVRDPALRGDLTDQRTWRVEK